MIQFLEFLRSHNDLHSDIEINKANISVDILGFQCFKTEEDTIYSKLLKRSDEPLEVQLESSLGEETLDDPLSGLEHYQWKPLLSQKYHQLVRWRKV